MPEAARQVPSFPVWYLVLAVLFLVIFAGCLAYAGQRRSRHARSRRAAHTSRILSNGDGRKKK